MEKFRVYGPSTKEESPREIEHRKLARRTAAEGMVLLRNENVLPLVGKKIALFGAGARMTLRGGTGSGDMRERSSVTIEQGLINAGFEIVNTKWMDRFASHYHAERAKWRAGIEEKIKGYGPFRTGKMFDIIHTTPFHFPVGSAILPDELSAETDTAIYVVARQAGESTDRRLEKGDFFLSDIEVEIIRLLAAHYKKLLLVINCGSLIDLSILDTIPNVGAILYYAQAGMEGGNAFADIVSGKVTPSGKLVDTWGRSYNDYPSSASFGYLDGNLDDDDYFEGIYVGYRYFDAFAKVPLFEFGHGLSYTTFSHIVTGISVEKAQVTVKASVRNTGESLSGKEVIQLYLEKPTGRLDHEPLSLAAFAKTKLLAPGEETEVIMTFNLLDQASFDEVSASWFLEKGQYCLRVGTSSRCNLQIAVIEIGEEIITEKAANVCPKQRSFTDLQSSHAAGEHDPLLPRFHVAKHDVVQKNHTYEKPGVVMTSKVKQILANLDDEDLIKICVGGGYGGAVFNITPGVAGTTTMDLFKKGIPNINLSDGPAGLNVIPSIVVLKNGSFRYIDGIPEDWRWGYLKYLEPFIKAKPGKGRELYHYMTAWPSSTLQAQTWDPELIEEVGQAVGLEMAEIGITLWLAPGMNIHRNPLCGRNFEYYSEDPLISGRMAAAITRGVQSVPGVGVTAKHFCCNNREDRREYMSSNLSERALREIYLRGFQYLVAEIQPWSVMSSYNKVNGVYTPNSHDLLTKVLRYEWGFKGLVMTDWNSTDPNKGSHADCLPAGNDLIMPGGKGVRKVLKRTLKDGSLERDDLKRCAVNVLNVIFNSRVVDGF